jgi:nucleotide-binding universal stress UspA family protein
MGGSLPGTSQGNHDRSVPNTVVVGVDGSEHSRLAVKWACDESDRRGSFLLLLFAQIGEPDHLPPWYQAGNGNVSAGEAVVDDAYGLVATRHPSVLARTEVVEWPPALALTVASRSAKLLVVGARGLGGFKELLLGSVSDQCIQYSHCPVVVVSETPDQGGLDGRRIVVGIDGSFGSSQALRWALEEARVRAVAVEAIHAWHYPPIGAYILGPPEGFEASGQEIVDGAIEFHHRWFPEIPFAAKAHLGATVPTLLDASRDADLLVLGSRGHGSFSDALLGSVAHQCARHGHGAVVVTRSPMTPNSSPSVDTPDGHENDSDDQDQSTTWAPPRVGEPR